MSLFAIPRSWKSCTLLRMALEKQRDTWCFSWYFRWFWVTVLILLNEVTRFVYSWKENRIRPKNGTFRRSWLAKIFVKSFAFRRIFRKLWMVNDKSCEYWIFLRTFTQFFCLEKCLRDFRDTLFAAMLHMVLMDQNSQNREVRNWVSPFRFCDRGLCIIFFTDHSVCSRSSAAVCRVFWNVKVCEVLENFMKRVQPFWF